MKTMKTENENKNKNENVEETRTKTSTNSFQRRKNTIEANAFTLNALCSCCTFMRFDCVCMRVYGEVSVYVDDFHVLSHLHKRTKMKNVHRKNEIKIEARTHI